MKIFELFAVHPFCSLVDLEQAYQDAIEKCDPMKQADINALTSAFITANEYLKKDKNLLSLIKSTTDLIDVLNKFPEYAYQIISTLDGEVGSIDYKTITDAFMRCAFVASPIAGVKTGILAGLAAASTQFFQQGLNLYEGHSSLASLVLSDFTNFKLLMTDIEPSLVLFIGFRLCRYPQYLERVDQFEANHNSFVKTVLSMGKDFTLGGDVSSAAFLSAWRSKSARQNLRHLLAYVVSMHQLELKCEQLQEYENEDFRMSLDKLFKALKILLMLKMQHADIDTLLRNQAIIDSMYQSIDESFKDLSRIASPELLTYIQQRLPFAFQVQFENALLSPSNHARLEQGSNTPLLCANMGGGYLTDHNINQEHSLALSTQGQDDVDESDTDSDNFYDANNGDGEPLTNLEYSETNNNPNPNPFHEKCEDILTQLLRFINNELDTYRKVETFRCNPNSVVKARYLIEIKRLLEAFPSNHADIETHREDIQAYCHLLQYVANIERGQLSSCTSLITETIDQRTPVRLTGTRTHENLIDLLYQNFSICFSEDLETKKTFLEYVAQRQSAQLIIKKLNLGKEPKIEKMHPSTPKEFIKERVVVIAQHSSIQTLLNLSVQALIPPWINGALKTLLPNSLQQPVDLIMDVVMKQFKK